MQAPPINTTRQPYSSPVDAPIENRPGVPAAAPPVPVGHAHWTEPPVQPAPARMLKDPQRPMTATFGVTQRPRALSGVMRRFAYTMPDYRVRRWALLIVADRIDALESRLLSDP